MEREDMLADPRKVQVLREIHYIEESGFKVFVPMSLFLKRQEDAGKSPPETPAQMGISTVEYNGQRV